MSLKSIRRELEKRVLAPEPEPEHVIVRRSIVAPDGRVTKVYERDLCGRYREVTP